MSSVEPDAIVIVYDGQCPFCSNYVRLLRLKQALGPVRLVDARTDCPEVRRVTEAGFDLDEGMALIDGSRIYHGDACIHRLALVATSSDLFNRLNAILFRSEQASRLLYPFLRTGRNLTLALLNRR